MHRSHTVRPRLERLIEPTDADKNEQPLAGAERSPNIPACRNQAVAARSYTTHPQAAFASVLTDEGYL
jgi:hypothetical protein